MNRTGQYAIVGALIMAFIGIIIGLTLLSPTVSNAVHEMTNTETVAAGTQVNCATGTTLTLKGKHTTGFTPTNESTGDAIPSSNYTLVNEKILTDGTIGSQVTWKAGTLLGNPCNVTYTYQPLGYATDGGSRAIADTIIIFLAIAIFVIALVPTLRNPALDFVKGYI